MHTTSLDSVVEADLRSAELTYDAVGRTAGALPTGYDHLHRQVVIGRGATCYRDAVRALFAWQMHLRSGFSVAASSATVEEETVAIMRIWVGPVRLSAPCRVIYVVNEPNRKGFAYGTLRGHPESGEEAFVIELRDDDTVSLTITAFSRPASKLARLGGPFSRLVQRRVTDLYLGTLADPSEHHG